MKLLKGLYGLKQAGRIWHERLKADMEELGYVQCNRDHAVFRIGNRRDGNWAVCAFWVDDETGVGSREQLDRVADMFRQKYGISGEGDQRWTLSLKVERDFNGHKVSISQRLYIENPVERFGLQDAHTVTTPLAPGTILTKDQFPVLLTRSATWLVTGTENLWVPCSTHRLPHAPTLPSSWPIPVPPISTPPYESYATLKGPRIAAFILEEAFPTSPVSRTQIGTVIMTTASPPVRMFCASDSG